MTDEEEKRQKRKPFVNQKIIRELSPYMNLGLQMAITIGLSTLAGWWLDQKFDTKPVLLVILALLGIVLAFYNFFKVVLNFEKKNKKDKK